MTGYWHCDFLINGKYYATISEIYETKKIGVVGYEDDDFKEIKPSKNNTKLEANIEYFEDQIMSDVNITDLVYVYFFYAFYLTLITSQQKIGDLNQNQLKILKKYVIIIKNILSKQRVGHPTLSFQFNS